MSDTRLNNDGSSITFEAIGTRWSIEVFGEQGIEPDLEKAMRQRIAEFDKAYSRFRDDSLVAKMAKREGEYTLPTDAEPMLDLYHDLYKLSGGLMTPLIGQALVEAGYDAHYSLRPKTLHQPPKWDEVLDYKFPKLRIKKPALLDFGALGKGYLVDLIAELIHEQGHSDFCVEAGGDLIHHTHHLPTNTFQGSTFKRGGLGVVEVGLEHPDDPTQAIGIVRLSNQALCGSAGNRRKWADYHHIIDPKKLTSPDHLKAVWVTADTTLLADAMTTALFFVSPETLLKRYTFEYVLVSHDGSLQRSPHFPAEFFTQGS